MDYNFVTRNNMMDNLENFKNKMNTGKSYSINFLGDSTMRNLFHAFCVALGILNTNGVHKCKGSIHSSNVDISFTSSPFCINNNTNNEVRVVGCGLWFLYPQPFTHSFWNETSWINFETNIHNACRDKKCIVSTPHYICSGDNFYHEYNKKCRGGETYCRNYKGSWNLRHRLFHLNYTIFDAFKLTKKKCDKNLNDDNLHFHLMLFEELTALLTIFSNELYEV